MAWSSRTVRPCSVLGNLSTLWLPRMAVGRDASRCDSDSLYTRPMSAVPRVQEPTVKDGHLVFGVLTGSKLVDVIGGIDGSLRANGDYGTFSAAVDAVRDYIA